MKVKLKNSLCPKHKLDDPRKQFGALNYFVFLLDFEFNIVKEFDSGIFGIMLELSHPKLKNNVTFRKKDCEFC